MIISRMKDPKWFLHLNPGEKIMMYQPKDMPLIELDLIKNIVKNLPITNAYYTKISINKNGEIFENHLIGIEMQPDFTIEQLNYKLDLSENRLKNFKFFTLSDDGVMSSQIKRITPFYKKNNADFLIKK